MTCASSTKISDLSNEVILLVLGNLDAMGLVAVAGTSRRMRSLAKGPSINDVTHHSIFVSFEDNAAWV